MTSQDLLGEGACGALRGESRTRRSVHNMAAEGGAKGLTLPLVPVTWMMFRWSSCSTLDINQQIKPAQISVIPGGVIKVTSVR